MATTSIISDAAHSRSLRLPSRDQSRLRSFAKVFRTYPGAFVGVIVLVAMVLAAFFLPLAHDPFRPDASSVLQPPSGTHWFGTDSSGFDVFARTVVSARLDLLLAIGGALASLCIGVTLGLVAGSKGRFAEGIVRAMDGFQAFPLIVLAIAIVTLTGDNLGNIVVAIAIIEVPRFTRLIRSEVLSLRESRFIEAATAIGASRRRLMFRHLLPNVSGVAIAQLSLASAHAIIVIAAMSFLGVGISPPKASWGSMIESGASLMASGQWWVAAFPGLAVITAVMCLNLIADGLDIAFNRTLSNA